MDGSLVVYDKEKEDAALAAYESHAPAEENGTATQQAALKVRKSVNSRNQKTNPVAWWEVSSSRANAVAFSPDCRHVAVVSEDGTLRILDFLKEQLLHVFRSYYGGLVCVCWSPDGRYVVTGGQDDLVSIWSLEDSMLVARCQGHSSWVTSVAFDPWRCDERNYRIGSVGEDCRLLLWDFSVGMLHRPRAVRRASIRSPWPSPLTPWLAATGVGATAGQHCICHGSAAVQLDAGHGQPGRGRSRPWRRATGAHCHAAARAGECLGLRARRQR